ncbi:MAG: ATP-binding protein [Anaerolineae bacterium]|jgi:signal transduction histidine kinase/DNA-binding response OmpR family regulator
MPQERVLIVEDSDHIRDVLRTLVLEPRGYEVLSAARGDEGLRMALEEQPDLVILDERMPGMTGVELLEALQEQSVDIPVIFTTLHGSEDLVVKVFRLGVRDYIIKPFEAHEMERAVERVLTEARLRQERDELLRELQQANERLERQVHEMRILYSIGRSVTSLLDLESVLKRVVEAAVFLTRAEEGLLMLIGEEGKELMLRAAKNLDEKMARGLRVPVDDNLAGETIRTGKPVLVCRQETKVATGYLVQALVYVPVFNSEQEPIGVLGITNRVTPRSFTTHDVQVLSALSTYAAVALENARLYEALRHQAEELANAVVQLEELDRLKNEFIQNVSHELRSPLALIRGYADLLRSGELGELPEEQQEPVEIIARRARMLGNLVEDIVLILLAEDRSPMMEAVQVDELARAAVKDFRMAADQQGLTLEAEISSEVPLVRGERTYVRRVLDNLLSNAVKFTPSGGSITIRVYPMEDHVALEVSDTGIGIPDKKQEHIFERFFQVDGSAKRRYGGVGLGLALVKEIVESCGGSVSVESVVDVGSTFTVRLPVYKPEGEQTT